MARMTKKHPKLDHIDHPLLDDEQSLSELDHIDHPVLDETTYHPELDDIEHPNLDESNSNSMKQATLHFLTGIVFFKLHTHIYTERTVSYTYCLQYRNFVHALQN